MHNLPDLEAWAIFAHVADSGAFAKAAELLGISQPTVSKAINRLEQRLGSALFYRTSRKLALTPTGEMVRERALRFLAEAEAIEAEASAQALTPQGVVRVNAPMSFGIKYVAPLIPGFLERYPDVNVDLMLTDHLIDVISNGFDVAIRIAELNDSSLRARRLCSVRRPLVASPAYLEKHGRPAHPRDLEHHTCLIYTNLPTPETWRFHDRAQNEYVVPVRGRVKTNNADVIMPALLAGQGIALQPEFLVWDALHSGQLEEVLPHWQITAINVHLVTPPGMLRPASVTALLDYLSAHLSAAPWAMQDT